MDALLRLCSVILPTGREKRAIEFMTTTLLLIAFVFSVRRYSIQSQIALDRPERPGVREVSTSLDTANPALQHLNSNHNHEHNPTKQQPSTIPAAAHDNADVLHISPPEVAKNILIGKSEFPAGQKTVTFRPGLLDMTNAETFKFCYAEPNIYKKHFEGYAHFGAISDKHKLIYFHVPKSGSSTARHVMAKAFGAREASSMSVDLTTGRYKDYKKITFVRPPSDRFLSSYDEIFIRNAPWERSRHVPKELDVFGAGLKSYEEYQAVFCPPALKLDFQECTFGKTHEDGRLLDGFEKFVQAYDGLNVFDVHLKLQAAMLSDADGSPLAIDVLLNTSRAKEGWIHIGETHGVKDMEPFLIHGRAYPRRFNVSGVSDAAKRRICRFAALDFCCLNFVMPAICSEEDIAGVFCNVTSRPNREGKITTRIEPFTI